MIIQKDFLNLKLGKLCKAMRDASFRTVCYCILFFNVLVRAVLTCLNYLKLFALTENTFKFITPETLKL